VLCVHANLWTIYLPVAYLEGGDGATAPCSLTVIFWQFWDNFCTIFVSFVSRLKRKIRVPRFLVTVGVFCLFKKNCIKIHPDLSFWGQNDILVEVAQPLFHISPSRRLHPLIEILKYAIVLCLSIETSINVNETR